jgi:hypothetical protein
MDDDEYRREDWAAATVREWLTSTYGAEHYITERASGPGTAAVLAALFTSSVDSAALPEDSMPQMVVDAWAELLAAERRRLDLYEQALDKHRGGQ